jgi:hypothetical protein
VEKNIFFEGWVTKKFGQENVSPQCPVPYTVNTTDESEKAKSHSI